MPLRYTKNNHFVYTYSGKKQLMDMGEIMGHKGCYLCMYHVITKEQ